MRSSKTLIRSEGLPAPAAARCLDVGYSPHSLFQLVDHKTHHFMIDDPQQQAPTLGAATDACEGGDGFLVTRARRARDGHDRDISGLLRQRSQICRSSRQWSIDLLPLMSAVF
jgi:hypothetical protein